MSTRIKWLLADIGFWGMVVVIAALVIMGIVAGTQQQSYERGLADACYARGGVPVQGDVIEHRPVICIDSSAVLK